jgi:pyruvate kinase
MEHEKANDVPIKAFKRTKIVATIGPSTNTYESIIALIKSGANGFRLNFSHGNDKEREQQIKWIRKAQKEVKKPLAIIQDLQGPKIRLGDFEDAVEVKKGDSLILSIDADYERAGEFPIQFDLSDKVKSGERLYISDGKIKATVTKVQDKKVIVEVQHGGTLVRRKGINLPDTDFAGDIITTKDKGDLAFGSTKDIDYVALSFVQSEEDIINLRKSLANLGSTAKIIAKIETKKAIDNLEEIIKEADAVMIARGDLATETTPESVPIVQRKIIELGKKYAKPSIVATQLLGSMTEMPEPTRAEVSDVATATILGADAVMLSDETASGKYPIEAIRVMKRVVNYTQKNTPEPIMTNFADVEPARQRAIPKAIISLAREISAVAIVAETKSGATAIQISSERPAVPVIAVTSSSRVAQQLAIVYGTKSYVRPDSKFQATKLTYWLLDNEVLKEGDIVITASGRHPGVVGTTDTIKVRVL